MQRLWAPWRMEYIGGEQPPGCLFCRVLADTDHDEQNLVLARPQGALVMLNRFPYNSGHAMVAPAAHVASVEDLDDAQTAAVMRALRSTMAAIRAVMKPEAFNIGANIGRPAGAGVTDHVHLHVVPRWNGDTSFMPVLADVKVLPEALERTAERLRPHFT